MNFRELTNEQRRQWLDYLQVAEELSIVSESLRSQFAGSMRWVKRGTKEYLHAKRNRSEKSLGPRTPETEVIFQKFQQRREEARKRHELLSQRVSMMAPVNRALGLGRVPLLTAKILRKLNSEGLLGNQLIVAGTNALFAYEAKAGVQFYSDLLATGDADLLWDARENLSLRFENNSPRSIMRILQSVDRSFKKRNQRDFKAVNDEGFSVDLIRPEDSTFFNTQADTVTGDENDLHGAPIFGLHWLLNAPRFHTKAIAEDGLEVPIDTFDPRAFSLHKLWMSHRKDRDPLKAGRDKSQALAVAQIAKKYLGLDFAASDLKALPGSMRTLIDKLDV